jgi:hypothetical protein
MIEKMDRAGIEKSLMPAIKCGVESGRLRHECLTKGI